MPHEFWREVVDRVAAEVPGTLLLAEAFWLLEGYFVRTLGMHRVYNSAFMNMLRDEENAKYRSYLKKTIEFDPDIMKRYVNFMSNPDERTAIDQFGDGDKYFGVATLLATLPGLPMFGHGQIEGYTERYGMEFKQAKMDEWPDERLVARHQAEIAPLLKNRRIFAESYNFTLYDFWNEHGSVDENVFAYSNRMGHERSIILYNNVYESTRGTIHMSAASMDKGSGTLRHRSLAQGLELPMDEAVTIAYRDSASGLEYLRRAMDFYWHGLSVDLRGYQRIVLLHWRELRSTAEHPWDRLCDNLGGRGVANVDEALADLRFGSLHHALRQVVNAESCKVLADLAAEQMKVPAAAADELMEPADSLAATEPDEEAEEATAEERMTRLLESAKTFFYRVADSVADRPRMVIDDKALEKYRQMLVGAACVSAMQRDLTADWPAATRAFLPAADEQSWAPVLAWVALRSLPWKGDRARLFDELRLRAVLADIFAQVGLDEDAKWRAAARVRVLLAHPGDPSEMLASQAFWADGDVRWLAGVNESEGKTYFNAEQLGELWGWMQLPTLIATAERKASAGESGVEVEIPVTIACEMALEAGYELPAFIKAWKAREVEQAEEIAVRTV